MTNEYATKLLKRIQYGTTYPVYKALDMAIEALSCSEKPNMSDTIYRQDAIDAIIRESTADGAYGYVDTKSSVDLIRKLPSAQPEQRWIPVTERLPENDEDVLVTRECSGKRYVEEACYMFGEWIAYSDEYKVYGRKAHKVLAWMKKVEPYKGDES